MATTITFIVGLFLSVSIVKSCSEVVRKDGQPRLTNLQLLDDNMDAVLLTINIKGTDNYYCKEMNLEDGSVGNTISCDQNTRNFTKPDIDPTNTKITSVTSNGDDDGTMTIKVTRNDEQVIIDSLMFNGNVLTYSSFVLDQGYTTYLAVQSTTDKTYLYGIIFESLDNNVNYTTFQMMTDGSLWGDFDIESDSDILVFQDVNVIALPLVCCLCWDYFVATYNIIIDTDNDIYNFTIIDNIGYNPSTIDVIGNKVYTMDYHSTVNIYDLETGQSKSFTDLSSNSKINNSSIIVIMIINVFSIVATFYVLY